MHTEDSFLLYLAVAQMATVLLSATFEMPNQARPALEQS